MYIYIVYDIVNHFCPHYALTTIFSDLDVSQLAEDSCIEEVDLRANPLLPACHEMLSDTTHVRIKLTERTREEWEDLDI